MSFDKSALHVLFKNIERAKNSNHENHYLLINEQGTHVAQIIFQKGGDFMVEIDNFPLQKQYFNSNIPIHSAEEFMSDMRRINLIIERAN